MPLMDRLVAEALDGLCPGCPAREEAEKYFSGEAEVHDADGDLTETDPDSHPDLKLGFQVSAAALMISTLILKEEKGCGGPLKCESCEKVHCGAKQVIDLVINLGVDTGDNVD